jgi:hypothetical protein
MNIKVKRLALIKSLEKALKARLDKKAAYEKAQEAYKDELKVFEATVFDAITSGKVKVNTINISNYSHSGIREVSIHFKLDAKKFKHPDSPDYPVRFSESQIVEIENAIAILNLSEEEFVNASTYKSVSQYIA